MIMQEAEVIALPRIIVKRWRDAGVDILVNNAGMGRDDASLMDGNTASWVEMVSTNTLGVCMCTREAVQVIPCLCLKLASAKYMPLAATTSSVQSFTTRDSAQLIGKNFMHRSAQQDPLHTLLC